MAFFLPMLPIWALEGWGLSELHSKFKSKAKTDVTLYSKIDRDLTEAARDRSPQILGDILSGKAGSSLYCRRPVDSLGRTLMPREVRRVNWDSWVVKCTYRLSGSQEQQATERLNKNLQSNFADLIHDYNVQLQRIKEEGNRIHDELNICDTEKSAGCFDWNPWGFEGGNYAYELKKARQTTMEVITKALHGNPHEKEVIILNNLLEDLKSGPKYPKYVKKDGDKGPVTPSTAFNDYHEAVQKLGRQIEKYVSPPGRDIRQLEAHAGHFEKILTTLVQEQNWVQTKYDQFTDSQRLAERIEKNLDFLLVANGNKFTRQTLEGASRLLGSNKCREKTGIEDSYSHYLKIEREGLWDFLF